MLDRRASLCTPYQPDARFTIGTAMGRNKIVYGLSQVTLVVTSADGAGGTWAGASEALKKKYGRVAVWVGNGQGPGNEKLVEAGGLPVAQPEAVLGATVLDAPIGKSTEQMALAFDLGPAAPAGVHSGEVTEERERSEPKMQDGGGTASEPPLRVPPGALVPAPTGICWCGCGKPVDAGAFFLPRHAPGAAQRALVKHFGSVEQFLVMMGDVPGPDNDGNRREHTN